MTVDLKLLRAFVAVAETENVGQAAERLHISQSPLSRQIMQLEAQLGLVLFERMRQRIRLTDEGRRFLQEARGLLLHAVQVADQARRLALGEAGRLTIGYVEAAMHSGLLPDALVRLQSDHADVRIDLCPMRSAQQCTALLERTLDAGLVYSPVSDPALEAAEILDEPLLLALSLHHPLARRQHLAATDLDGLPWVALSQAGNPQARQRLIDHCRASGFQPDIRLEAEDLVTALRFVACGLGATFIQSSLRDTFPERLVFRELPWFPHRVRLHAVWRRADPKPMLAHFRHLLAV